MPSNHNEESNAILSIWKKRKKAFLILEMILAITATIFAFINVVRWNTDLTRISFLVIFLVGAALTLRGIESRLNKEKGHSVTLGFGIIICILAIIPLVKYLWN